MPAKKAKQILAVEVPFVGGPRDGEKIRVSNPPSKLLRLAVPSWATYEYNGKEYEHIGDIPIEYPGILLEGEPGI